MNEFERDNAWQRGVRDAVLAPGFYGKYAVEGRYVVVDKGRLATTLQRRYAVDTIVQAADGAAICIEEKIVRWKGRHYSAFCLETDSCTVAGHESDGWMKYAAADYLLYAFQQPSGDLSVHLVDFPQLQEWFWGDHEAFPAVLNKDTLNRSAVRLVPIDDVKANVRAYERYIHAPPDWQETDAAAVHRRRA